MSRRGSGFGAIGMADEAFLSVAFLFQSIGYWAISCHVQKSHSKTAPWHFYIKNTLPLPRE
jgi:hypothetical protein